MADPNYLTNKKQHQHEKSHATHNNNNNPGKFYSHFLYKALAVTIFLLILPLFPSQAPDFINQTLNTRGWEFLHLVFVGIAVSYGLFSKQNDESQHDNNSCQSKFENAQSYVSRFLQLSSVFDDESDSSTPFKVDNNRVQTWSSQYQRNEPVTIVAEENSTAVDQKRSLVGEKPLLLPVRSLKSRVLDSNDDVGLSKPCGPRKFSSKNMNWVVGDLDHENPGDEVEDYEVLSSPIPWRSRSERMEMKVNEEIQSPLTDESIGSSSFKSQPSRSSRPNSAASSPKLSPCPSMTSSPKKYAPSPPLTLESQGKSVKDFVKKKSFYRSPPPPPPPPPPPSLLRKASSVKQSVNHVINNGAYVEKDLKRSFTSSEPKDNISGSISISKSNVGQVGNANFSSKDLRRSLTSNEPRTNFAMPKLARTTRSFVSARKEMEFEGYETSQARNKMQSSFAEFAEDEMDELVEKLDMESEEESLTEEEDDVVNVAASRISQPAANSNLINEEEAGSHPSDGGPDVDKKADEFIAKFREQIRLQRIESIKRSSTQHIKRNTGQ